MSIRRIEIAGHYITIRAKADDEHLNEVIATLDERVRAVKARIADSTEALLFVSLALTDELLLAQQRLSDISERGQARIGELLQLLDRIDRGGRGAEPTPEPAASVIEPATPSALNQSALDQSALDQSASDQSALGQRSLNAISGED